jgi:putative ABC transport system substrate-binding protein
MRRRQFITLLGGASVSPVGASAQQPAMPIVGFLGSNTPATQTLWTAAFVQRLRELGWIEGRNVSVEYRWADSSSTRAAEFAAELANLKAAVIVTSGSALVAAAKRAAPLVPIVFAAAADPVASGLVTSLARPGGNVTGLSVQYTDLAPKRLELLREVVPQLRKLAILVNSSSPGSMLEMQQAQAAARELGLEVLSNEIRQSEDIGPAFERLHGRADALYVCSDPLIGTTNRIRINILSLVARLPTMHGLREHVEIGALMSYGTSFPDMFRRSADYVDKILRGTKPGDIPVEQPTKFELVVNLITARALKLDVPPTVLARADEVIE